MRRNVLLPTLIALVLTASSVACGGSVEREIGLDRRALDVFRADGAYLGEAEIPEAAQDMHTTAITSAALYGTVKDELEVSYVVRMRIVQPKG